MTASIIVLTKAILQTRSHALERGKGCEGRRMGYRAVVKYWEIITDKLSAAGWSWGMTTAIDVDAGKVFIVDAHRSDRPGRIVVRSDELLTAFLELEQQVRSPVRIWVMLGRASILVVLAVALCSCAKNNPYGERRVGPAEAAAHNARLGYGAPKSPSYTGAPGVSSGGVESVAVLKIMNSEYKAIVQRRNGETYLIDYGIGGLSLWRYEGKSVLIHSPGRFCGLGSSIILPENGQKARIWNAQPIDQSSSTAIMPSARHSRTPRSYSAPQSGGLYVSPGGSHWVQSKSDDGEIVTLEDGSVWSVDLVDRIDTMLWLPTTSIIVVESSEGYLLINSDDGEKVHATLLRP